MLVCFAMKEEAGAFKKLIKSRPDVSVLITGIGKKNTEKAVADFLAQKKPNLVLTCGFAGGLDPQLAIGAVVFTTSDATLASRLVSFGATPVRFTCSDRIATTVAEKKALRDATNADAVEMESEAVHALCYRHKIPCATVRAISDTANDKMPLDFNKLANADLSLNSGKLARAIAKAPWKIPALRRLQKNSRLAAKNLANVLQQVIASPPAER